MQAHCVDEKQDLWVVYDTQTRYAAVVNGRELADQQEHLTAELATRDVTRDEKELLRWAKEVGFVSSWDGQQVEDLKRQRQQTSEMLAAIEARKEEAGGAQTIPPGGRG